MSGLDDTINAGLELTGDPSPLQRRMIVQLIAASCEACQVESGVIEVGVSFVDVEEIADLNREHRNVDAATDVLSFPIDARDPLPAELPRQLGDLVICTPVVLEQLAAGETMVPRSGGTGDATLERALARCVVHGALHLLGEDHEIGEVAALRMFELEERALHQAGFGDDSGSE